MDCSEGNKKTRLKFKSLLFFLSGVIFGSILYGYFNDIKMDIDQYVIWFFSGYISYVVACVIKIKT